MTIPSFSHSQRGNQEAAANHYRERYEDAQLTIAALRNKIAILEATQRSARRALTQRGDVPAAIRLLTAEVTP